MDRPEISVIMPALNEEANVLSAMQSTLDSFDRLRIKGEIIVVNDGSRDKTGSIAAQMSARDPRVRVLTHTKPHGLGASFWDGVQHADGDAVVMLPGDGENEPDEILRYVPLMQHVDIIVPFVYNREIRAWSRRIVSKIYKFIINVSFRLLLNYMNGTVVYRRSVFKTVQLRSTGFFYQTELLIKSIRSGYLFAEVPYALGNRSGGKAKALTLKSFFRVSRDYLRTMVHVNLVNHKDDLSPDTVTYQRRHKSRVS